MHGRNNRRQFWLERNGKKWIAYLSYSLWITKMHIHGTALDMHLLYSSPCQWDSPWDLNGLYSVVSRENGEDLDIHPVIRSWKKRSLTSFHLAYYTYHLLSWVYFIVIVCLFVVNHPETLRIRQHTSLISCYFLCYY